MLFVWEDTSAQLMASETPSVQGLSLYGGNAKKTKEVDNLFLESQ